MLFLCVRDVHKNNNHKVYITLKNITFTIVKYLTQGYFRVSQAIEVTNHYDKLLMRFNYNYINNN